MNGIQIGINEKVFFQSFAICYWEDFVNINHLLTKKQLLPTYLLIFSVIADNETTVGLQYEQMPLHYSYI